MTSPDKNFSWKYSTHHGEQFFLQQFCLKMILKVGKQLIFVKNCKKDVFLGQKRRHTSKTWRHTTKTFLEIFYTSGEQLLLRHFCLKMTSKGCKQFIFIENWKKTCLLGQKDVIHKKCDVICQKFFSKYSTHQGEQLFLRQFCLKATLKACK